MMDEMLDKMKMAKMGMDESSEEDPEISVLEEILSLVQDALGSKMAPKKVSVEVAREEPPMEEAEMDMPMGDESEEEKLAKMMRSKGKM
jgi:hypothetical protein